MSPRVLLTSLAAAALAACGGRSLMYSASNLTTTAPADVYACAQDQAKKLGYRLRAHDDTDYRLVMERDNEGMKEPTGLYRRGFDRLELTAAPDASGKTTVAIKAQSYVESVTARGNTLDEKEATAQARTDSKTIMTACGPS